jgi:hypothetical protein
MCRRSEIYEDDRNRKSKAGDRGRSAGVVVEKLGLNNCRCMASPPAKVKEGKIEWPTVRKEPLDDARREMKHRMIDVAMVSKRLARCGGSEIL